MCLDEEEFINKLTLVRDFLNLRNLTPNLKEDYKSYSSNNLKFVHELCEYNLYYNHRTFLNYGHGIERFRIYNTNVQKTLIRIFIQANRDSFEEEYSELSYNNKNWYSNIETLDDLINVIEEITYFKSNNSYSYLCSIFDNKLIDKCKSEISIKTSEECYRDYLTEQRQKRREKNSNNIIKRISRFLNL